MLARVDGSDGEFAAVHRTWLRSDGSDKAELREPKMSWGPIRGGAVRLASAGPELAIAEGIENAADLQALLVMGCDFGQGVLIAPPMPQQRFLDLLRQRTSRPRARAETTADDDASAQPHSGPPSPIDHVA